MLIVERQQKLRELIERLKVAQLEQLATSLGVSVSTVRRDLEALEQQGVVERTHGGAVYREKAVDPHLKSTGDGGQSIVLAERMTSQVQAKQAIGRHAASLVTPHMTVLMDGGSMVIFAARLIQARPLQVVTNSLTIANLFNADERVELTLLGGSLYPRTEVTLGPLAITGLSGLHANVAMFSLAGIYGESAYNINHEMAKVERLMIQQADQSIMLMDSTKFGRKSLVEVCALEDVNLIITDDQIDPIWRDRLGDRLRVASP